MGYWLVRSQDDVDTVRRVINLDDFLKLNVLRRIALVVHQVLQEKGTSQLLWGDHRQAACRAVLGDGARVAQNARLDVDGLNDPILASEVIDDSGLNFPEGAA